MKNATRYLIIGFVALILFQLLVIASIVQEAHWLGPVQDFWGSIPFIEKTLASGNWLGADLWIAQNNHRLVLPRLAFLIDYRFFSGTNMFLTMLGFSMIALEALLLSILLSTKSKQEPTKVTEHSIVLLAGLAVLTLPLVVYNLLHTFNTQWLQCAALAFLACTLFARGLEIGSRYFLIAGIAAAIACQFTTFTLTAIWPALFLLLWMNRTRLSCWLVTAGTAFIFSAVFVFLLPTENIPGGNYILGNINTLAENIFRFSALRDLSLYIIAYLSLPDFPLGDLPSRVLTIASLLWLVMRLLKPCFQETSAAEKTCLALMFFCLCLAATTAVGRAYMGSVGLGPRFGPIVLLYWAAFVTYLLLGQLKKSEGYSFYYSAMAVLLTLALFSAGNALNMGKRLSEDYNRFVIPQMAELHGNHDKNAIYENLVVEWRETSYPGIIRALPYLQKNERGIFSSPLALFIKSSNRSAWETLPLCGRATITQKPRNQDASIRNLLIQADFEGKQDHFSHLILYNAQEINGLAFRKRQAPLQSLFKARDKVWTGISNKPLEQSTTKVLAFSNTDSMCQLDLVIN